MNRVSNESRFGALAAVTLLAVVVLAGCTIDATTTTSTQISPPSTTRTAVNSARTTSSQPSVPTKDLPAVPLGQSQTIAGTSKKFGDYKAKVVVTAVTRMSESDVVISAKIDVLEGTLPLSSAWSFVTKSGKEIDLNLWADDAFGSEITGTAEGTARGYVSTDAALRYVRLQPRYRWLGGITNQAATWSIGNITTSMTSTPIPSETSNGRSGGTPDTADTPYVDVPNPDVPNVRSCINGRDSRGRFC